MTAPQAQCDREPDERLVLRVAQGDRMAFARLVTRHRGRLTAMVARMVGDAGAAEDVAQEAFLRAWVKAPGRVATAQGGTAQFATWLSRVAMNLAIDRLRRRPDLPIETAPEPLDPAPDAEAAMLEREQDAVLACALAVSLAVNLFLVGVFAGRVSFQPSDETPAAGSRGAMFLRYQALPRTERAPFRATMLRHAGELRATQQALRAAQAQAVAALQATPYDRARMLQAFAAVREATQARQAVLHAALADAIGTLPPEARSSIAGASGLTQP